MEEQIVDSTEVIEVVKNNPFVLVGVAIISLSAGAALGYRIAKKRLEPKFAKIADDEIREARERYKKLYKADEFETPAEAVKALIPQKDQATVIALVDRYSGRKDHSEKLQKVYSETEEIVETVVETNIFVEGEPLNADEWDYDVEKETRTDEAPFIIHHDEFFENSWNWESAQLTWWAKDGILADAEDRAIDEVDVIVGEDNMEKFGHGSGDANLIYICNPVHETLLEVAKSEGSYAEEVHGVEITTSHSSVIRRHGRSDE